MDFHILAIIVAIFMFLLAPTSFDSLWARRTARFIAVGLVIWGLTIFHPIVTVLVISVALGLTVWFGVNGLNK